VDAVVFEDQMFWKIKMSFDLNVYRVNKPDLKESAAQRNSILAKIFF